LTSNRIQDHGVGLPDRVHPSGLSRRRVLQRAAAAGATLTAPIVFGWSAAAQARPIKIGGIGSLTGVVSVWGQALREGAELAVEEINADGGILGRKVDLVLEDDESKVDVGTRKARKLALEDQVDMMFGINHSGVLLSVAGLLPTLKKVLIASCATSTEATTQRFNEYLFRVHTNADQEGASGALYAVKLPHRRWSVIAPNYAYGFETWGAFISNLKRLNPDIEIMNVQAWPAFGAPDYSSHITRLLAARPDAVLSAMWGGDAVNLVRQLQRFRFLDQVAFFTPAALAMDVFYALGPSLPENLHTNAHAYWFETPQPGREEANQSFIERYRKRHNVYPHSTAHGTYTALKTYKKAAEKAGSTDTADVIAALEGIEVEMPAFKAYIRKEDHQIVQNIAWGRTAAADELPFKRRLTDFQWTDGEKATPSVDEILARRKAGGQADYYRYIVGG
jgi:branched-chain amino acid transport system substrate-binding protein